VGVFEYSCIEVGKSRSNIHVLGWAKVCCACIGVDDCLHHDDDCVHHDDDFFLGFVMCACVAC